MRRRNIIIGVAALVLLFLLYKGYSWVSCWISVHNAAAVSTTEELQAALNDGDCNVDCLDLDGETPIMRAVQHRNHNNVLFLIGSGADVNRISWEGVMPIHHAMVLDDDVAATALIRNGANVNGGENGTSPLIMAAYHGAYKVAELLLKEGADVNPR